MIKDARRIGVYGRSGSGKSTRVKAMVRRVPRVVTFDPLDEYRELGFKRALTERELIGHIKRNWRGRFRVAYVPPSNKEAFALHRVSLILKQIQMPYYRGVSIPKLTLVVEEMNLSFPVTGLPQHLDGFPFLCSRGRHWGIEIIGVSQRVAEVNTRFRGNTDVSYFFAQQDATDIRTICSRLGNEYREKLIALKTHEYLQADGLAVRPGKNRLSA